MDLSPEFCTQFEQLMEQTKQNVLGSVCIAVCRELDAKVGPFYELFRAEINKYTKSSSNSTTTTIQNQPGPFAPDQATINTSSLDPYINNQPIYELHPNSVLPFPHTQTDNSSFHQDMSNVTPQIILSLPAQSSNSLSTINHSSTVPNCSTSSLNAAQKTEQKPSDGHDQAAADWHSDSGGAGDDYVMNDSSEGDSGEDEPAPKKKQKTKRKSKGNSQGKVNNLNVKVLSLSCTSENCELEFDTLEKLEYHLARDHGTLKHRCFIPGCGRSFERNRHLSDHLRDHHPGSPECKCSQCGLECKNHDYLKVHFRRFHLKGRFRCIISECDFTGITRQAVVNHYNANHGKFVCSYEGCGKSFSDKPNLKCHERALHSGAKPFRCKWDGCSYSAANYSNTVNMSARFTFDCRLRNENSRKKVLWTIEMRKSISM